MITLPNGCKCSNLSVYPKNWQTKSARITIDWYIIYRFYHPHYAKPKQVMVKGMNKYKSRVERQTATEKSLENEMNSLVSGVSNPFKTDSQDPIEGVLSVTPILKALRIANEKITVAERTKKDIKFMLSQVGKAVISLNLQEYPISKVTRKTIKLILEAASNSPDRFNKNRSYLMILFSELCELEYVETNVVRDIRKKKVVKRIRQVLTNEERKKVNEHLENIFNTLFFMTVVRTMVEI